MRQQGARNGFKDHLLKVDIPEVPKEEMLGPGQANLNTIRQMQVRQLNNLLKSKWKSRRKKGIAPKLQFGGRPDYAWRDRILLCGDCETLQDRKRLPPRRFCECSTMIEVDMTVPYSKENCMCVSCEVAQMIREDVWLKEDEDGSLVRCEKSKDGTRPYNAFPVSICATCRKTSIDERRRFKVCKTCEGVAYCSDECMAQHRMVHKATCTLPHLPDRQEWGVRKPLRKFSKEVYPLIKRYLIRAPEEHRIKWLPRPPVPIEKRIAAGEEVRSLSLPGFGKQRLLPTERTMDAEVQQDGSLSLVKATEQTRLRRPRVLAKRDIDDYALMQLNMTREEYDRKDDRLRAAAEKRDQELVAIQLAREAEIEQAEEGPKPFVPFKYDTSGPVPKQQETFKPRLGLRLKEDALGRIDEAAKNAPTEPSEREVPAPWVDLDEEEELGVVRNAEVMEGDDLDGDLPPGEREGVVRKKSLVEQVAGKRGLKLSPQALKRLEAAATAGKGNEKNMDWIQPAKGPDF